MRTVITEMIILLVKTILCSNKSSSRTGIQFFGKGRNEGRIAHFKELFDSPEEMDISCVVACPHGKQRIFYIRQLLRKIVTKCGIPSICQLCYIDCQAMMRQALVNCQDRKAVGALRWKILKYLNVYPKQDISAFFNLMELMPNDYEYFARNPASTRLDRVKSVIAGCTIGNIYSNARAYKLLASTNTGYVPVDMYSVVLAKYLASGPSASQILDILRGLLQREYFRREEKYEYAKIFVDNLLETPFPWLKDDDVYMLIVELLRHGVVSPTKTMLSSTDMVHTIEAQKMLQIFKCCFIMGDDGLAIFKQVWFHGIYLRNMELEQVQWIRERLSRHLEMLNGPDADNIKEAIREMYRTRPKSLLSIDEAKEIIKKLANKEQFGLDPAQLLDSMAENGVVYTMMQITLEERMQIFESMLDGWNANLAQKVYLEFPESLISAETDLLFLKYLTTFEGHNLIDISACIRIFARRQYFGYEMLLRMLDILSSAGVQKVSQVWLILAAERRHFFKKLSAEEIEALHRKLNDFGLIEGIALLKKYFSGVCEVNTAATDICSKKLFHILPKSLQAHLLRQSATEYIFTIWCESITFIIDSIRECWSSESVILNINFYIATICKSTYFMENVSGREVENFIARLLKKNCYNVLSCINIFLMVACPEHVRAAKTVLFKKLTERQLTAKNISDMAAMGFRFERTSSGFIMFDESEIPVDKMLDAVDKYSLLELVKNRMREI